MTPASNDIVQIHNEDPSHLDAVEALLDEAFGPGRFAKTAYRLREGTDPIADLSFVAMLDGSPIGAVRLSPITIGGADALFLGPLVVHPDYKNRGHGLALMRKALAAAKARGHRLVVLVGDAPYYARADFAPIPSGQVTLPGPVDPNRLLAHELVEGALSAVSGMARPAPRREAGSQGTSAAFAVPGGSEGEEQQDETEHAGKQGKGTHAA
jgi:predicted N-acetyltransferase YhbS